MTSTKPEHQDNPDLLIEDIHRMRCKVMSDPYQGYLINRSTMLLIIDRDRLMSLKAHLQRDLMLINENNEQDSFMGMKVVETFGDSLSIALESK